MSQPAAPQSPCIQVCVLGAHGYCTGCYRTIGEIARWSSMSAAEQRAVLDELPGRAPGRAPQPD
ncbi:MAG: DUF1289 domain-containing protein [Steroidobacteraceae bacterium]